MSARTVRLSTLVVLALSVAPVAAFAQAAGEVKPSTKTAPPPATKSVAPTTAKTTAPTTSKAPQTKTTTSAPSASKTAPAPQTKAPPTAAQQQKSAAPPQTKAPTTAPQNKTASPQTKTPATAGQSKTAPPPAAQQPKKTTTTPLSKSAPQPRTAPPQSKTAPASGAAVGQGLAAGRGGAAPATPRDSTSVVPSTMMREAFDYNSDGRRDPFISLLTTTDLRPTLSDLKLLMTVVDEPGRSVALVQDAYDKSNPQKTLRVGTRLGRMRVSSIRADVVVFTIEEFGSNRRDSLMLRDPSKTGVGR